MLRRPCVAGAEFSLLQAKHAPRHLSFFSGLFSIVTSNYFHDGNFSKNFLFLLDLKIQSVRTKEQNETDQVVSVFLEEKLSEEGRHDKCVP